MPGGLAGGRTDRVNVLIFQSWQEFLCWSSSYHVFASELLLSPDFISILLSCRVTQGTSANPVLGKRMSLPVECRYIMPRPFQMQIRLCVLGKQPVKTTERLSLFGDQPSVFDPCREAVSKNSQKIAARRSQLGSSQPVCQLVAQRAQLQWGTRIILAQPLARQPRPGKGNVLQTVCCWML
jgi:hypothetical protein